MERFQGAIQEAVGRRLRCDVPICFHLSGGLDSSAVLALAAKIVSRRLDAYTVTFPGQPQDESDIAHEMARHVGATLHPVPLTSVDLIRALPDAVFHGEGLAVNGHLPSKFLLNRAIRNAGFKVSLTGEGADEILAGYPHLKIDLARASGDRIGMAALLERNPGSRGIMLAEGPSLSLEAVRRSLGFVPAFLEAKGSLGYRVTALLSPEFRDRFGERDAYRDLLDAFDVDRSLRGRHPVDQSLYLWSKTALAGYILRVLGDGMEMASGVEGRLPFLDRRLVEAARDIPLHLKIRSGVEKYVLREAIRPLVTDRIYRRSKHPFVAPPLVSTSNPTALDLVRDQLHGPTLRHSPFFDRSRVLTLFDGPEGPSAADRSLQDPVLWTLLSCLALQERFQL